MPRIAKNQLVIVPLLIDGQRSGAFLLHGYINGKQIRKRNTDLAALEAEKVVLESAAQATLAAQDHKLLPRMTWLSQEQVRDAEAAYTMLKGSPRTLSECVHAAEASLGSVTPKDAMESLAEWKSYQERVHIRPRTLEDNKNHVTCFIKLMELAKVKNLQDITPRLIELYVLDKSVKPYTQCRRGSTLKAWLNFCVKKKLLKTSPFDIDMDSLTRLAKLERGHPPILTPDQAQNLLTSACVIDNGIMVPYVILTLWCFVRNAEAQRVKLEDISFKDKKTIVDIWPRKQGSVPVREVTVPSNVAPLLKECVARGIIKPSKFDKAGKLIEGGIPFSRATWIKIREKAGLIKTERTRGEGGFEFKKIVGPAWAENILRHSGITYLYKQSEDIKDVVRQAGNSVSTAFRHYVKHIPEGDAQAFYRCRGSLPKRAHAANVININAA